MVCRMLANLPIPISMEEKDILLAAALCHDMIEDIAFSKGGTELMTDFGLDSRVYEVVKLVSKRKDFTPEEEKAHFHGIERNPLALMVKLSDRGHNIEDLYNMSTAKVHEYIDETRRFFLPMCEYGLTNYPEIGTTIEILQNKLLSLTKVAEVMVDRYGEREQELEEQLKQLKEENENLRKEWKALWEE